MPEELNKPFVRDIRRAFIDLKQRNPDGNGPGGTLEIMGAQFIADEETIFGRPDYEYIERELIWYHSKSLYVDDIPERTPQIWLDIAGSNGRVNSNYGHLIWSDENGKQFDNVVRTLRDDPDSRRATMIYTRPTMHTDAVANGMNDFVCTNAVNYFIRGGRIHAVVQMRSNDVVFGYRNDFAWQSHVLTMLAVKLGVPSGNIVWGAASLHVYPRHFHLIPEA